MTEVKWLDDALRDSARRMPDRSAPDLAERCLRRCRAKRIVFPAWLSSVLAASVMLALLVLSDSDGGSGTPTHVTHAPWDGRLPTIQLSAVVSLPIDPLQREFVALGQDFSRLQSFLIDCVPSMP